ncbi:MAG: prepilin-type N-terminal cleavage/methylation domain-containing protein [Candidatus Sumerlaeia bacterium]|nr:prepilin-type N-terminal cleavage/methylation domain-containing protein [Candidatus Sumerlaeia bacterium]
MRQRGFTLIELLIVVAIIAILAAIAVPNFLEAQTRAKVSRAKADIRSMATAIEAYYVDYNAYPIDGHRAGDGQAFWYVPTHISSPVAYITTADLVDPFRTTQEANAARLTDTPDGNNFTDAAYRRFRYINYIYTYSVSLGLPALGAPYIEVYGPWRLNSAGPDRSYGPTVLTAVGSSSASLNIVYDPTNGTISRGDIMRSQKESDVRTR